MLKCINKIRNFGVFNDYTKPADIEDFSEKNIIYGWNYSGKTTISRIFQSIETRSLVSDFSDATFTLIDVNNVTLSENNLATVTSQVRVFNSDFIASNLSWDGESFEPILLLGDESIEAKDAINKNDNYIDRIKSGIRRSSNKMASIDNKLRDAKTRKSAQIKRTLGLVEAYTATHLNQKLPSIRQDPSKHLLKEEDVAPLLKKALASDNDKLAEKDAINIAPSISANLIGLSDLLTSKPTMVNTIENLANNGDLAKWVKHGLELHEGKTTCEFCDNPLSDERLQVLNSHFSKDLAEHESKVSDALTNIENAKIVFTRIHKRDFYPVSQDHANDAQIALLDTVKKHNNELDKISSALKLKLKTPFNSIDFPSVDIEIDKTVSDALQPLNEIIDSDNAITNNFTNEKNAAISKLKSHYIAEFCIEQDLNANDQLVKIIDKHKSWYKSSEGALIEENAKLEAKISQAQKGREELNTYIGKFISGSSLVIEVVKDDDQERFLLTRNGESAKNLSEGEKTAIAFAFFLTKLKECPEFDELIVFIDDPISSLDSNHLFQLNAVIRDFFFLRDVNSNPQWKLTVKQIFFSTHNFEFLGLLKGLPIGTKSRCKYYLVKRVDGDTSTFIDMPESIKRYSSEYQYLWSVIHAFYTSDQKDNLEVLLALPNAVRRFVELYTYSKIPSQSSVDTRAEAIFGPVKSVRILKVLHYFSHSNNLHGIAQNNDLISDIENVVNDLVAHIETDTLHHEALMESVE